MNYKFLAFIFLPSVLLLVGAGCSRQSAAPVNNQPVVEQKNVPPVTEQPSEKSTVSNFSVMIKDFAFQPADLTVAVGTKVVWTQFDSVPHIIFSSGNFESASLNTGETFQYTFSKPGVYNYNCKIHPSMTGKITVR